MNPTSLVHMMNTIRACFLDLTAEDRSALKEGIASLYSIAAITVTASADRNIVTACFAVWLNPGAVFAAFLPMAAVYIVAYLCWRQVRSPAPHGIPRGLDDPRMDTIMLIDVLGVHMLLPLERVSTWKVSQ